MVTGETWRLGRRPALDGLRGVAVLLVLFSHAKVPWIPGAGAVGVFMFFTLSGFLITTLLLEERAKRGRISFGAFYLRRTRRLLPALVALIAVVTVIGLAVPGIVGPYGIAAALFYVSNWAQAIAPVGGALGHTWSLAIEEQFYLVWPLVFVALLARYGERAILLVAGLGSAVSVALRFLLWDGGLGEYRVHFGTDTHADALLIGCGLAVLIRQYGARPRPVVAAVMLGGLLLAGTWTGVALNLGAAAVVPWLTAGLIWSSVGGSRWLESRPLRYAGARSYAVYLWQYPLLILVERFVGPGCLPQLLVMVPATWLLAELSWRFVEQPVLRRPGRVVRGDLRRGEGLIVERDLVEVGAHSAAAPAARSGSAEPVALAV